MAFHINNESALNWTGVIIIVAVAIIAIARIAAQSGWTSPQMFLAAPLLLSQLGAFLLIASDWAEQDSPDRTRLLFRLQGVIIVSLYLLVDSPFIAILGIVWVAQATEVHPRRAWLLLGASVAAFGVTHFLHWPNSPGSALANTVTLGIFHLFALITTQRFRREQQLREEAASLNRELLATRELLASHSRQEERLRIARDLHDSLGHHMTALILQLEVATHRPAAEGGPPVRKALDTAKQLLHELRGAVAELRHDDRIDLRAAVDQLTRNMPGLNVACHYPDVMPVYDMATADALLRCIQEGLTNAARHSHADRVDVTLHHEDGEIRLHIADNGRGSATPVKEGNGLTGMRERVAGLDGALHWEQSPRGFRLDINLPLRGAIG